MSIIFEVIDKKGRSIRLTKKQWCHICEHPEMVGKLENIRETITLPENIIPSPRDPQVHYFFRYLKQNRNYLLVAIKYLNGDGFVITAFETAKMII